MSTKEELVLWHEGVTRYKAGNIAGAAKSFREVGPFAKAQFNIGMIYSRGNDHESADIMFGKSIQSDPFFAVAYFQKGHSLFLLYEYELAEKCFRRCLNVSDICLIIASFG
jgi:neutrophil factor 2